MEKLKISEVKTGDTILVHAHSFLANTIQEFQEKLDKEGGRFNHAMMSWRCYDELFVIEALAHGITPTNFAKDYLTDKHYQEYVVLRPKFKIDGSEYGKFMLPQCNRKRYNFFGLIAEAVRFISKGKIWIGKNTANSNRYMCGQWCYVVYQHFNPSIFNGESQKIAPVDLYLMKDLFDIYLLDKTTEEYCEFS